MKEDSNKEDYSYRDYGMKILTLIITCDEALKKC